MVWTGAKAAGDQILSADWNSMVTFLGSARHAVLPHFVISQSSGVYSARQGHTGGWLRDYCLGGLINRCLAGSSSSGMFFIKPGTYTFKRPAGLKGTIAIQGSGHSTIFQLDSGATCDMFVGGVSTNLESIMVRDVKLDGNSSGGSGFKIGSKYALFRNVWFYNFTENGLEHAAPQSAGAGQVNNCWFTECGGYGAKLDYRSFDWFLDNVYFKDCGTGAVYFNGAAGTHLKSFNIQGGGITDYGIYCNETGKLTFSDFVIQETGKEGIYIYSDSERRSRLIINDGSLIDTGLDADATYCGININGSPSYPYKYCNLHDLIFHSTSTSYQPLYDISLDRNQYTQVNRLICSNESFDAAGGVLRETNNTKVRGYDVKKTSLPIDLTGGTVTLPVLHCNIRTWLTKAQLVYSVDATDTAGVVLAVGNEADSTHYWSKTLVSASDDKTAYSVTNLGLENYLVDAGDTIIFSKDANVATTGELCLNIQALIFGGGTA